MLDVIIITMWVAGMAYTPKRWGFLGRFFWFGYVGIAIVKWVDAQEQKDVSEG